MRQIFGVSTRMSLSKGHEQKEVETMQNHLCQLRLLKSRTEVSPDFRMEEFDEVTCFKLVGSKVKVLLAIYLLRGLIDHSNYLAKELWITFYDIEKCFDSLWV